MFEPHRLRLIGLGDFLALTLGPVGTDDPVADSSQKPDFSSYHRSLGDELFSTKDRIRNLVRHWPTDGEHKEAALRSVLRRILPPSLLIGRGFVVNSEKASTQVDILIADAGRPTLFRDGDLLIVTPEAVRAVIEVKTDLGGPKVATDVAEKLAGVGHVCESAVPRPWLGLFIYEEMPNADVSLLRAAQEAFRRSNQMIDSICCGRNTLILREPLSRPGWRSYGLGGLAPSNFIGRLAFAVSHSEPLLSGFAWLPVNDEAERLARNEIKLDGDVTPCHGAE